LELRNDIRVVTALDFISLQTQGLRNSWFNLHHDKPDKINFTPTSKLFATLAVTSQVAERVVIAPEQ
jgi:hypothetical protein